VSYCHECKKIFSTACHWKRHDQSAAVHLKKDAPPVKCLYLNCFKLFPCCGAMREYWIACTWKLEDEKPIKAQKSYAKQRCKKRIACFVCAIWTWTEEMFIYKHINIVWQWNNASPELVQVQGRQTISETASANPNCSRYVRVVPNVFLVIFNAAKLIFVFFCVLVIFSTVSILCKLLRLYRVVMPGHVVRVKFQSH